MKKYLPLLILLAFCGCTKDRPATSQPVVPPSTPEQVLASFAAELNAMAGRYPELAGFPKYYESLPDKLRIRFDNGMKPIETKRYVRPDDFEPHGISLQFDLCDEKLVGTPTINATTRHFRNLHLRLYAAVNLSASPSPGLREELQEVIARHITMLEELDDKAANKADARDGL